MKEDIKFKEEIQKLIKNADNTQLRRLYYFVKAFLG